MNETWENEPKSGTSAYFNVWSEVFEEVWFIERFPSGQQKLGFIEKKTRKKIGWNSTVEYSWE